MEFILKFLNNNCCDGIYNSIDVHFTNACDNNCAHCIDMRFTGKGITIPDTKSIIKTIQDNCDGVDDVLFLGGEPFLFINELLDCVRILKQTTKLKLFVTTAIPKVCLDEFGKFEEILSLVDGINLSVQHYREDIANNIRRTKSVYSLYNRQQFYESLPMKEKIRINLNIVKPFLYEKDDIINCLNHYDKMGFNSIKISEIQHGVDQYVSFENTFGIKLSSPYSGGCQTYIDGSKVISENFKTPILLKRSCFACESTLKASVLDGIKVVSKLLLSKLPTKNKYFVVYGDGSLTKGWV